MIKFNLETKLPEIVRLKNPNRFLIEGWIFGSSRLKNLSVQVGKKLYEAEYIELFRPDVRGNYFREDPYFFSFFSGFSIPIILNPIQKSEEREVILEAEFKNNEKLVHNLGIIKLEPWQRQSHEFKLPHFVDEDDLLVICMATFNPKEDRFKRQVESIINQDYRNWICIVSDDCSDEIHKRNMHNILANDDRFYLIEHTDNVGFYHNFERCLELVPSIAKYVALSDQDDYWYPNKISECLQKLKGKTQLVYCDMRIVYENGNVISKTYWINRKNYYKSKDADLLVIANTVTGAATIFRANLLEKILPFPPRYGNIFHDNWIAIIAAASGGIEYIDLPLYDYIQNNENVIGHCDFSKTSLKNSLGIDFLLESYRKNTHDLSLSKKIKSLIIPIFLIAKDIYGFEHGYCRPIITHIETASIRNLNSNYISILRRPRSVLGLIKMHMKVIMRNETTNNIELKLLLSRIVNSVYPFLVPSIRKFILRREIKSKEANFTEVNQVDSGIIGFKRMFSGRKYSIVENKPFINFFISLLDPPNFFGGYLAMFNFAKKFSETGYPIRILLTDQKEIIESDLEKIRNHDKNLREFLTKVEFQTCYSSEQIIPISKEDIFVATSVWTAHIAHEATKNTNYTKFIYLTQEYEPIFFEHNAYRVLAEQSYKLDYFPFISTDILQKYFIESGIMRKENAGIYFRNPVLKFDLSMDNLKKRKGKKKLLFYARPQAHATRNLYPLGCLAIDKAREMGYFQDDEWEVIGIGGGIGEQMLPSGIKIKHIGRFDMQEYKNLLPEHDLGLALMYSPHPSLLPIEMASAGLLVVTNTYDNIKNQEYFSNISKNIRAVPPDHESLAFALIELSNNVDNHAFRIEGSSVNWPHDWDEALPRTAIEKSIVEVTKSKN